MNILFVISEPPGTEKATMSFRLADEVSKKDPKVKVRVFLHSQAVLYALDTEELPDARFNIGTLFVDLIDRGAEICACESDLRLHDARKLELIEGVARAEIDHLADWVIDADKVIAEI